MASGAPRLLRPRIRPLSGGRVAGTSLLLLTPTRVLPCRMRVVPHTVPGWSLTAGRANRRHRSQGEPIAAPISSETSDRLRPAATSSAHRHRSRPSPGRAGGQLLALNRLCRRVRKHFRCRRLTGSAAAMPIFLSLILTRRAYNDPTRCQANAARALRDAKVHQSINRIFCYRPINVSVLVI